MAKYEIAIETRDGRCPAHVYEPDGEGPWPAVIMYMDGPGLRPALFEMAARLASHGYVVLLPDLFYRLGGSEPDDVPRLFVDPAFRKAWMAKYLPCASLANVRADSEALLAYLATHPRVKQPHVGAVGYCMGGGHAITAAGHHPDRVVAVASYHGGSLATDAPDSPHLLSPSIAARLYIAAADEDPLFPDAMKARLEAALDEAGVSYVLETYAGERHGFAPHDTPVHTKAAGERHWASLLALFAAELSR